MTIALGGPFVFLIPLLIAIGLTFGWLAWSRPANPPRFSGYAVRQDWQVDPMALLDRDLRAGRWTAGIIAVHDRLLAELTRGHRLTPAQIRRRFPRARRDPAVDQACRALRSLEATYPIAYRAEDPARKDLWSRWRRPVWQERARREFQDELSQVEALWPLLEKAP